MAANNNSYKILEALIMLGDIVILNSIIIFSAELLPRFFPKVMIEDLNMVLLVANCAMLVAEFIYRPIVHTRLVSAKKIAMRVTSLVVLQTIVTFILLRLLMQGIYAVVWVYAFTLLASLFVVRIVERFIINKSRTIGHNTQAVLFLGNDPAILDVYNEMTANPYSGYRVKGYYGNDDIPDCPEELKRLGTMQDFETLMNNQPDCRPADEIYCSISHTEYKQIVKVMRHCNHHVMRFYYVPRNFGTYRLHLIPEQFGESTIVFTNRQEPLQSLSNRILKRTFDICFSLCVCIFLVPITIVCGIIIKLSSPGPIFFRQERTGFNGQNFNCLKFRSMHCNDDADKIQATKDDPRKFAFGNFMRKANIDELPQFFNVLLGDMSIVGPRPHMLLHTEQYSELIDQYMVRHFSKPGITGWAQVTGSRGETKELWQMEERVMKDIWYIENWSFWLDIKIIAKTFLSMFIHDKEAY